MDIQARIVTHNAAPIELPEQPERLRLTVRVSYPRGIPP